MRCDPYTGSLMKQSQSNVWISYINHTNTSTGYLVFPNCPFDYCNPLSVPIIDLNQVNGADMQCAFNRSGLLCGSCQPGLSLSLGSSRCLLCPSYWPVAFVFITTAALLAAGCYTGSGTSVSQYNCCSWNIEWTNLLCPVA